MDEDLYRGKRRTKPAPDTENLDLFGDSTPTPPRPEPRPTSSAPVPQGPITGRQLRDQALAAHEANHRDRLERARDYAERLAISGAVISADDIRQWCDDNGIERGPWMGAVFRGSRWEHVGWKTSDDPTQHATGLRTWRLRDEWRRRRGGL